MYGETLTAATTFDRQCVASSADNRRDQVQMVFHLIMLPTLESPHLRSH